MNRILAPVALVGVLLALAVESSAQPATGDVDKARALFNVGAQAYDKGDFRSAIDAFGEAYGVSKRPGIAFSLAQAHRRQYHVDGERADLEAAIRHYRAYLEGVPRGGRRGEAAQALVELEPLLSRLDPVERKEPEPVKRPTRFMVSSPAPGARISLDGGEPGASPLVAIVSPGAHTVRVTADGYAPATRQVLAVEGEVVGLDMPLRELLGSLVVTGSNGADVFVERRLVGRIPFGAPVELRAGRHRVDVVQAGREPRTFDVEIGRGERRVVTASLRTTAQRVASYVTLGSAGASLVAGGAFAAVTLARDAEASDLLDRRRAGNVSPASLGAYRDAREARDDWRSATQIALGGAVALGAIGAALYLFDTPSGPGGPSSEARPTTLRPEPLGGTGFVGAAVSGAFW